MDYLFSEALAHIDPKEPTRHHLLIDHLSSVANIAGRFASKFNLESYGRFIGYLHDIGKYHSNFQQYLLANETEKWKHKIKHSPIGALVAQSLDSTSISINPIAAHHTQLYSNFVLRDAKLKLWKKELFIDTDKYIKFIGDVVESCKIKEEIDSLSRQTPTPFDFELLIRMLYSCLIDADWLDTEAFFSEKRADSRRSFPSDPSSFLKMKDDYYSFLINTKQKSNSSHLVNTLRNRVNDECILFGRSNHRGFYKLSVPTGGGKTIASMGFALEHLIANKLDRIIYAIPFTSIIDQTASIFKRMFRDSNVVLEHHSGFNIASDNDESKSDEYQFNRFASQNWNASVVLTTTVQLFDSLFSNHPSDCRKLHNICNSVIVIDEVQTLPLSKLQPIVSILNSLVKFFGCSVVLCTATQPSISKDVFRELHLNPTEIIPEAQIPELFQIMKRVEYKVDNNQISAVDLVDKIAQNKQALCICNTKNSAREIAILLKTHLSEVFQDFQPDDIFHLSTNMCSLHRKDTLEQIRVRLNNQKQCYVVSTQLIEAGVDLDFPVVFRASAPLDRIIQAAGRCNREGKLPMGEVIVFKLKDEKMPSAIYKSMVENTEVLMNKYKSDFANILDTPVMFDEYYKNVFASINLDSKAIQDRRKSLDFPEVAARGHLIDSYTQSVIVNYKDAFEVLSKCQTEAMSGYGFTSSHFHQLQSYLVNLPLDVVKSNITKLIETCNKGLLQATCRYDKFIGLDLSHTDFNEYIF